MRISRRVRRRLITLMLIVAIAGMLPGWLANEMKGTCGWLNSAPS